MSKLLKIFFYYFYHNLAWTYDIVSTVVSLGRWQAWRRVVLQYLTGPRVLEIGFGTGHLQVELNERKFQIYGLDESWQMAKIAKRISLDNDLKPRLVRGLAQTLPFATESMDNIFATFPSEYVFNKNTLAEIMRVLKPSGQFVVIPLAWLGGKTFLELAASWLFKITGQTVELTEELQTRLSSTFRQAGFEVEMIRQEFRNDLILVIISKKSLGIEISTSH